MILELERVLEVTPEAAFAEFADAARLAAWWGPNGFSVPSLDFEPRVGGSYRIAMQPPEGDAFALNGEFREVEPPERLAFTFVWDPPDDDDVETLVELTFRDAGGRTEVWLRQGEFTTEARLELHRAGWTEAFDRLQRRTSAT